MNSAVLAALQLENIVRLGDFCHIIKPTSQRHEQQLLMEAGFRWHWTVFKDDGLPKPRMPDLPKAPCQGLSPRLTHCPFSPDTTKQQDSVMTRGQYALDAPGFAVSVTGSRVSRRRCFSGARMGLPVARLGGHGVKLRTTKLNATRMSRRPDLLSPHHYPYL